MTVKNQRWWLTTDSENIVISAPADKVYCLVAELTRMGEWSPECQRVEWEGGATGPAVGAKFVGHNRGGPFKLMRWSRRGRVLTADPGREFAFATEEGGHESTVWSYRFEPTDDGRTRLQKTRRACGCCRTRICDPFDDLGVGGRERFPATWAGGFDFRRH